MSVIQPNDAIPVAVCDASRSCDNRNRGFTFFPTARNVSTHLSNTVSVILSPPGADPFPCHVPVENLVGVEGQGFISMLTSLGWERIALASLLGLMEADLNLCLEYVKERKQFGKPIGSFQQIQAKLSEMKMDLEAARWLTYHLAWKKDRDEDIGLDAAITKTFLTEAGLRNSLKAVQIFGGYGCMREYPIGRNLMMWKAATIGGGTSEIQRNILGRMLTGL